MASGQGSARKAGPAGHAAEGRGRPHRRLKAGRKQKSLHLLLLKRDGWVQSPRRPFLYFKNKNFDFSRFWTENAVLGGFSRATANHYAPAACHFVPDARQFEPLFDHFEPEFGHRQKRYYSHEILRMSTRCEYKKEKSKKKKHKPKTKNRSG